MKAKVKLVSITQITPRLEVWAQGYDGKNYTFQLNELPILGIGLYSTVEGEAEKVQTESGIEYTRLKDVTIS